MIRVPWLIMIENLLANSNLCILFLLNYISHPAHAGCKFYHYPPAFVKTLPDKI